MMNIDKLSISVKLQYIEEISWKLNLYNTKKKIQFISSKIILKFFTIRIFKSLRIHTLSLYRLSVDNCRYFYTPILQ